MDCFDNYFLPTCFVGDCEIGDPKEFEGLVFTQCVCRSGWEQTAEMSIYFLDDFQIELGVWPCTHNTSLIYSLYGTALGISVLTVITQLFKIKRRSQVKRLTAFFSSLFLISSVCIYKLSAVNDVFFGENILFTLLSGMILFFCDASAIIFFEKYIRYHSAKIDLTDTNESEKYKLYQKINYYLLPLSFLMAQFFWISSLPQLRLQNEEVIENFQTPSSQIILRISLCYFAIRIFLVWLVNKKVMAGFIRDINNYLEVNRELQNSATHSVVGKRDEFINAATALVRNSKSFQVATNILLSVTSISLFLSAVFNDVFLLFGYIWPFILICWSLGNFRAMRAKSSSTVSHRKKIAMNIKHSLSKMALGKTSISGSLDGSKIDLARKEANSGTQ